MNPRITSMENLIASDPGGRNVFGLVVPDQLRLAAQSLRLAKRVGIVSGFYVPQAGAGETDGPPGAKLIGDALGKIGIPVDYVTDPYNAPLFSAMGLRVLSEPEGYLDSASPTHLVSVERAGRGSDGRYRNMRGVDITPTTPPLDELFIEAARRGLTTIGIGDGGNEIGMGRVFAETLASVPQGQVIASIVPTDFCIAAGVSNWGACGLAGALSILASRDLLPTPEQFAADLTRVVEIGHAVDGVTCRREITVDGLALADSLAMLERIRQLIVPSPLDRRTPITAGILGYGKAGRAAATLLARHGHRVCISDERRVTLEKGLVVAGVETGGHTAEFLAQCDLVVASPGVRGDALILGELHRRSIPVISELELAYQLCPFDLIAVTGTVGKRSTVELMERMFAAAGCELTIGGNKGEPLSAILLALTQNPPGRELLSQGQGGGQLRLCRIALAVSSFQLESVVHFRPHIAILLNIDAAHLDRHASLAEYVRIKSRVFMNHRPEDILVLPFDDPRIRGLARKHHGRTFFFSTRQAVDRGAWLEQGALFINLDGVVLSIGLNGAGEFPENLLAAVLAARLCGLDVTALESFLKKGRTGGP